MATKSILTLGGDGTAVPAGFVGATVGETTTTDFTGTSTTSHTLNTIDIPQSGVWRLDFANTVQNSSGTITAYEVSSVIALSVVSVNAFDSVNNPLNNAGSGGPCSLNIVRSNNKGVAFYAGAATTLYHRLGLSISGGGSGTVKGRITATRIS